MTKKTGYLDSFRVNHHAFDDAENNPEAQYWIGFLMADGSVCPRKGLGEQGRVALSLAAEDRSHVLAFRKFLGSNHAITVDKTRERFGHQTQFRYAVSSSFLFEVLVKYGVTPRKTYTAAVQLLAESRDFWRGVIDGDGCICFGARKHPVLVLSGGSRVLIEQFASFVQGCGVAGKATVRRSRAPGAGAGRVIGDHAVKDTRGFYDFRVCAYRAAKLTTILYRDCCMALPRKMKLAETAMNWKSPYRERVDLDHLTRAILEEMYDRYGSWKTVAKRLGIDSGTLVPIRRRFGFPIDEQVRWNLGWMGVETLEGYYAMCGNWRAVCRYLGVPYAILKARIRRVGLPNRHKMRPKPLLKRRPHAVWPPVE